MPRGLLIGCALVLWPMTIAGSAFVMAWLREAVRQRRVRLMPGVAGLFDVFVPATLLGPALAGLVVHRVYWSQNVLGEDAAASPGEARSAGRQPPAARKQGLLFREKEAKSFCPGCRGPSHRRVPKRQKFFGSFFQKRTASFALHLSLPQALARMAALSAVPVAGELFWLTRPMNLDF